MDLVHPIHCQQSVPVSSLASSSWAPWLVLVPWSLVPLSVLASLVLWLALASLFAVLLLVLAPSSLVPLWLALAHPIPIDPQLVSLLAQASNKFAMALESNKCRLLVVELDQLWLDSLMAVWLDPWSLDDAKDVWLAQL